MKFLQLCLLGSMAVFSAQTFAQQHTVSLGYAQSEIEDNFDINGINVQYRYETASPVSVLASMSYQTGDEKFSYADESIKTDVKHFSLLAGPAYRFNALFSAYALAGFAHTKAESTYKDNFYSESIDLKETNFAYGAGVIVTPTPQLSLNVGYEGTEVDSAKFNGFNVGVGYRF